MAASQRRIPSRTKAAVGGTLMTAMKMAARIGTTMVAANFIPPATITKAASETNARVPGCLATRGSIMGRVYRSSGPGSRAARVRGRTARPVVSAAEAD